MVLRSQLAFRNFRTDSVSVFIRTLVDNLLVQPRSPLFDLCLELWEQFRLFVGTSPELVLRSSDLSDLSSRTVEVKLRG